jgi:anti-sigma factor RsiW
MACDREELIGPYVDEELDAAHAAEIAAHVATCARCAATERELLALRRLLREAAPRYAAPEGLRIRVATIAAGTEAAARVPAAATLLSRRRAAGWAAIAAAVVAGIGLGRLPDVWREGTDESAAVADRVLSAHLRALRPDHLVDVVSSDRHTVKPWFAGRVSFAPPVKDLAADGFPLVGARLDVVGRRTVAALVYRRRQHSISLFVWPDVATETAPIAFALDGYNVRGWRQTGFALWVCSDLAAGELDEFVARWRATP